MLREEHHLRDLTVRPVAIECCHHPDVAVDASAILDQGEGQAKIGAMMDNHRVSAGPYILENVFEERLQGHPPYFTNLIDGDFAPRRDLFPLESAVEARSTWMDPGIDESGRAQCP
jgi:hypothetical protein